MLGAQARAAELQAAKSAALRQRAHREAEDQPFPPESTQFLLTDFARNPLATKNKGVKAFRPLIDSDFESTNPQSDYQTSASTASPTESANPAPLEAIPTAPRAMLVQAEAYTPKMISRASAPSFTPRNPQIGTMRPAPRFHDGLMQTLPIVNAASYPMNNIYGPDDLSPDKQENKFEELRQQHRNMYATPVSFESVSKHITIDSRAFTLNHEFSPERTLPHTNPASQMSYGDYTRNHPSLHYYEPGNGTTLTEYESGQTHFNRVKTFTDDVMEHQYRFKHETSVRDAVKHQLSNNERCQSYDRNSKMQSFVAAQQAMAKTGKTVLHNPDLHKHQGIEVVATSKLQALATSTAARLHTHPDIPGADLRHFVQTPNESPELKPRNIEAIPDDHMPCNRENTESDLRDLPANDILNTKSGREGNVMHRDANQVLFKELSEDWHILRTVTSIEKDSMLRKMKRAAEELSSVSRIQFLDVPVSVVGKQAQKWLLVESVHQSLRRSTLNKIVSEYERHRTSSTAFGIIGKPISKGTPQSSSRGTLKSIANIMATLYDSRDARLQDPKADGYTATPIYAVQNLDESSLAGTSLFDNLGFRTGQSTTNASA